MADGSAHMRPRAVIGFAGGGGSSVAYKLATGCDPDVAMNHWLTAVLAHQRHFPETQHYCADIFDVDPATCLPGEEIAFGWFSPDCTDFSKAKGKAPRSERIRGLAWSVIPWAVARRIRVIMLENVEEFAQWGPVHRTGARAGEPIAERRGETFRRWKGRLEALGYSVEWRILNAADYGAPTTRKRLYLIARCDGRPIVWPQRTHAPRKDAERLGLKPWVGACEIIDWSLDCPSIFLEADEVEDLRRRTGKRVQRPLVAATQKRIARGMERYVIGAAEPFLVNTTQRNWGGERAHGVRGPVPTLTSSKGGEYALAAAALASVAHGGDARAWAAGDPARTQTSAHDKALVTANLVGLAHGEHGERPGSRARDVGEPVRHVSAGGGDGAVVAGHLVRTDMHRSNSSCAHDGRDPLRVNTSAGGLALVAAALHQMNTRDVGGDPADPARTQPGREHLALQAAHLVRQFGSAVGGTDASDPLRTVLGQGERGGGKDQLVTAWMAQGNGERLGRAAEEPTTTQTERGTQQQLVAASLDVYYTTGQHGADVGEPARTSTGKDRLSLIAAWMEQANTGMVGHAMPEPVSTIVAGGGQGSGWGAATQRLIEARLEQDGGPIGRRDKVLDFLWRHFGVPTLAEWADPTGTLAARLKFGIVLIPRAGRVGSAETEGSAIAAEKEAWLIVDIGLRMLTPRELAAAMGLPPEYDLSVDHLGRPISKTHQTQMIGNMVSPPPAAALIAANCPELCMPARRAA